MNYLNLSDEEFERYKEIIDRRKFEAVYDRELQRDHENKHLKSRILKAEQDPKIIDKMCPSCRVNRNNKNNREKLKLDK